MNCDHDFVNCLLKPAADVVLERKLIGAPPPVWHTWALQGDHANRATPVGWILWIDASDFSLWDNKINKMLNWWTVSNLEYFTHSLSAWMVLVASSSLILRWVSFCWRYSTSSVSTTMTSPVDAIEDEWCLRPGKLDLPSYIFKIKFKFFVTV